MGAARSRPSHDRYVSVDSSERVNGPASSKWSALKHLHLHLFQADWARQKGKPKRRRRHLLPIGSMHLFHLAIFLAAAAVAGAATATAKNSATNTIRADGAADRICLATV